MQLDVQGRAEQLGRVERRLGRVAEAAELCGAAELLGVPLTACTNQCSWMCKAEQCGGLAEWRLGRAEQLGRVERRLGGAERLGRVERRLGRAVEAAELCGAAELLGVPLTITPLSELH